MFETNIKDKGFRRLIEWAFLIPMIFLWALLLDKAPGALSVTMEWICIVLFWALLIARMIFRKFVKENLSEEELEEFEETEERRNLDSRFSGLTALLFIIIFIIGVYLTAWVLKK